MDRDPDAPARLLLIHDPRFDGHASVTYHPERPKRLDAALRGATRVDGDRVARAIALPREAERPALEAVHDPAYLDALEATLRRGEGYLDPDTYFGLGSREAAWLAAGGACALVDALIDDVADVAALLARPPGHHATRSQAMGFCLLNNIAVAAGRALARGVERVAIVDWDVHHGNGTQAIFAADPRVLFVSLHESPLYPNSGYAHEVGAGDARGRTVNVPLPAGSGGATYRAAFDRVVLPMLGEFAPSLVLVSAGFDAHARDPLANMQLQDEDYGWMAERVRDVAQRCAAGRVGIFLEGGYDLQAIEGGMEHSLRGLTSTRAPSAPPRPDPGADLALRPVIAAQKPYWKGVL